MEAATVAWHPLGWTPLAFSEIEPFPKALLQHKYPNIPNYGDLTKFDEWPLPVGNVDLVVGGTPCQAWSVAGKRLGLDDPRGRVALAYAGLIEKHRPRWIVWENVPGVYSAGKPGGADFAAFVGALAKLGYSIAYRTLNAEYFGVPQRRRRCILVGYLGDWRPAAAVLFESESLCRDIEKGRKARKGIASNPQGGAGPGVGIPLAIQGTLIGRSENAGPGGVGASVGGPMYTLTVTDVHAVGVPQPIAFQPGNLMRRAGSDPSTEVFPTVKCDTGDQSPHVAMPVVPLDGMNLLSRLGKCGDNHSIQNFTPGDPSFTLKKGGTQHGVLTPMAVRRLTAEECEALQGFPKGYSKIPWKGKPADQCPDGPRYKACGNSMAVPVMAWVGQRIALVDKLISESQPEQPKP